MGRDTHSCLVDILMSDPSKHTQSTAELSIIMGRMENVGKSIATEDEKWQKRREQHLNYITNIETALCQLSSIRTNEELDNLIRVTDSKFSWNTLLKKKRTKPFVERVNI